jgi:hypothetical protein
MRTAITVILTLTLISCSTNDNKNMGLFDKLFGKKETPKQAENISQSSDNTSQIDINYQNKLFATKQFYPFNNWRENYDEGLTQYTEENCKKTKKVFDELINSLVKIGENANENDKVQLFKKAILTTNELNEEIESLIETGEREDLCELTDKIAIACGLDPLKYGDGEGLASEWREW